MCGVDDAKKAAGRQRKEGTQLIFEFVVQHANKDHHHVRHRLFLDDVFANVKLAVVVASAERGEHVVA